MPRLNLDLDRYLLTLALHQHACVPGDLLRPLSNTAKALHDAGSDLFSVHSLLVTDPGAAQRTAKWLAERKRHDALICLGAIIRGETDHYDHVAGAAATVLPSTSSMICTAGRSLTLPTV